jgi:tRNA(Arg) A34 adenosine deaminase TadA
MKVKFYFNLARRLALRNQSKNSIRKRFLFGVVAIRADGVLVCAANGFNKIPNRDAHAEVKVLRKCDIGAILFVVRISREDGSYKIARPCPRCMATILNRRVKRVYYSISNNEYGVIVDGDERSNRVNLSREVG